MEKITLQQAEHYKWGNNCDGWHLLRSSSLSVIQEMMPPGTEEKMHFHTNAQQLFYILSGNASFDFKNETVELKAGESLHVPKGTHHHILNKSNAPIHFLVISEPMSHGDRTDI